MNTDQHGYGAEGSHFRNVLNPGLRSGSFCCTSLRGMGNRNNAASHSRETRKGNRGICGIRGKRAGGKALGLFAALMLAFGGGCKKTDAPAPSNSVPIAVSPDVVARVHW